MGFTQLVIWMLSGVLLYRVREPILLRFGVESARVVLPEITWAMAIALLVFFVLGYVFYASLFAAVGATVNSEQEAQQAQLPVVLMLVSSVALLQAIITRPDSGLATTLSLLPFSAPIVMPLRMAVVPVSVFQIILSMVLLAAGCLGVVWLAGRIYRVGMLMYGKRPTTRELLRWIRA